MWENLIALCLSTHENTKQNLANSAAPGGWLSLPPFEADFPYRAPSAAALLITSLYKILFRCTTEFQQRRGEGEGVGGASGKRRNVSMINVAEAQEGLSECIEGQQRTLGY